MTTYCGGRALAHLFAYGTLMDPDVMAAVSRCRVCGVAGVLHGYRRRALRGACYPGIEPAVRDRVSGVLYRDLPRSAWARLDRFEGGMYRRVAVTIRLEDHSTLRAATYVIKSACRRRLQTGDWDPEAFGGERKALWLRHWHG